ncbi:M15 family metallopeptidase [Chitinimonas sp.]|uniref:M15 family metallopeptidase n=1 Tax=Chitinimonas sp. TaxID=1934313 RepID=UPI002F925C9C
MNPTPALAELHAELGIPADYAAVRQLQHCAEAGTLVPLGLDCLGRDQFATAAAAAAWHAMQAAAAADQIELQLVSAFRSVAYQANLIRKKLATGLNIANILTVSAAPGYSEHHTGRALDITTPGYALLEEDFEQSPAYAWLQRHGSEFGFSLSYPRDNPNGIAFEPWHWCHHPISS